MTKCLGKPPIWGMVPEIQSGGKIFSSFWAIFCPFTSLTTRKIKILKKWKKLLERSSFYTCNKNHDLMMYASWDIERDRQNFLSFWASFCPFSPLTTQKIKFWKNEKNAWWDIIILHKCTKNHDQMLYCSWGTVCDGCNCYFSFWAIFSPFTLLPARKIKMKKTPGAVIILHMCTKNYDQMVYGSWDIRPVIKENNACVVTARQNNILLLWCVILNRTAWYYGVWWAWNWMLLRK